MSPTLNADRTARELWAEELANSPARDQPPTTVSGRPIDPLYTSDDLIGFDDETDLGYPGQYPFTRGVHASMYRGRLWTMRQFAGFGTPRQTNERFKFLLEKGQTGLSTAFDLPTLMGLDSDDPRAFGEVGRLGVAMDTLDDMLALFDGINLEKISVSMTINAPGDRGHGVLSGRRPGTRLRLRESFAARSRMTSSRSFTPRTSSCSRPSRACGWCAT